MFNVWQQRPTSISITLFDVTVSSPDYSVQIKMIVCFGHG